MPRVVAAGADELHQLDDRPFAWQEQLYWLKRARGHSLCPSWMTWLVTAGPPRLPPRRDVAGVAGYYQRRRSIPGHVDDGILTEPHAVEGQPFRYNIGTMLNG